MKLLFLVTLFFAQVYSMDTQEQTEPKEFELFHICTSGSPLSSPDNSPKFDSLNKKLEPFDLSKANPQLAAYCAWLDSQYRTSSRHLFLASLEEN